MAVDYPAHRIPAEFVERIALWDYVLNFCWFVCSIFVFFWFGWCLLCLLVCVCCGVLWGLWWGCGGCCGWGFLVVFFVL